MKLKNIFTYSLNLTLLNEYLEVFLRYFEPKIFNEKVEVLFYKIKKTE